MRSRSAWELSDICDDERATCSAVSLSCSVAKRSEATVSFMDEASEPSSLPDVQDERTVRSPSANRFAMRSIS